MGAEHSQGLVPQKIGSVKTVHTFTITMTQAASGVATKLFSIQATATEPATLTITVIVETPSDATTSHTLSLGKTGSGYTDVINAFIWKAAAVGANGTATVPVKMIVADTDYYFVSTFVGTPTAGRIYVIVETAANVLHPTP